LEQEGVAMKKSKTHIFLFKVSLSAVFSAIIFIATAFLPRIPTLNGYIHLGDSVVFLAGAMLPFPCGIIAAGLGGGLADLLSGYPIWIPITVLVKAATALMFSSKTEKYLSRHNLTAILFAALYCVVGYYIYEAIFIAGNYISPLAEIPMNLAQIAINALIFIFIAALLDRNPEIKKTFSKYIF
jgi:uncharacterized repeat protein (TIGR04002 family)